MKTQSELRLIAVSPVGITDACIPIAASRAQGIGILDLSSLRNFCAADELMAGFCRAGGKNCGVRVSTGQLAAVEVPPEFDTVILTSDEGVDLAAAVRRLKQPNRAVLLEATSLELAKTGEVAAVDGIIAKGNEAGGWVGEETTFILLQRVLRFVKLPVWAQGGIGLHTVAACYAAGAVGVVLDSQLALTRESSLDEESVAVLKRMDGSETVCLGTQIGAACRMYCRGGHSQLEHLRRVVEDLANEPELATAAWRTKVAGLIGDASHGVWLIGQDTAFSASLANRFRTVWGVFEAFRNSVRDHIRIARNTNSIGPDSPLAQSHGTRYPVVQGPMTRVSDTATFALEVADGGGLPFLALALMRAPEVASLLERVASLLAERPWGVGILGFVPPERRREQLDVVHRYRPPFALIAGGRPDQSQDLERIGIRTYLHVPSPALLRAFLENGARRFVFEGRECGGHVGPRSSFVLWNSMVDVLLESLPQTEASECDVLFAGGIHDAVSASMTSVLASPLAERGVRIGVLLGSAYLFTRQAVNSGAIVSTFQQEALRCSGTVLLESGRGHSIRCVKTRYAGFFEREKTRLEKEGRPPDEVRSTLEEMNVGKLRIASKGIRRGYIGGLPGEFETLTEEEQRNEGMYMIGQVAALRDGICTIEELHRDVSTGAWERLQQLPEPESVVQTVPARSSGIAIIGMACLLPQARTIKSFWENILNKVDAITEIPVDRWDWHRYFNENPKIRDKIYSRWGGFLDEVVFNPVEYRNAAEQCVVD